MKPNNLLDHFERIIALYEEELPEKAITKRVGFCVE
jgi:hypothetical protein